MAGKRRFILLFGLPLLLILLALNSLYHRKSTSAVMQLRYQSESLRYVVMIDAGSSGSRAQIYSYAAARDGGPPLTVLNGNQSSPAWELKITPGISSLAQAEASLSELEHYFTPLIVFAQQTVPAALHSQTPVYLMATAGMRLLPPLQQQQTLGKTCQVFQSISRLLISDCQRQFQVISGQAEGLYGWVALNYLVGGFSPTTQSAGTVGFIDMGGASMQIAFQPADREIISKHADDLQQIAVSNQPYSVFSTTYLGFGANEARRRFVKQLLTRHTMKPTEQEEKQQHVNDPCLPSGFTLREAEDDPLIVGTGQFDQCMAQTLPLLNKSAPCTNQPCLFDGIHTPGVDFRQQQFVGVSEFWYTAHDLFDLGGPYSYESMASKARSYCSMGWQQLKEKYASVTQQDRLYLQCFKTAWILTVLHDGFQIPTHPTITAADRQQSQNFRTMDAVEGKPIAWTLGAALLKASESLRALNGGIDGVLTLNTPWFFVKLILLSAVLVIFCLGLVRLVINNSFDHPWNGGGVEGLGSGGGGGGVRDWLSGRSSTAGSLLPMTMADSSAQSRDRFNKFSGYR